MDWFPWYFIIYKADTMHLNPYQDGCYRRLIDHYMESRQSLIDSDVALARIVGDSEANWVAMASPIVRPFFHAKNGRLFNKRCELLLAEQDRLSKKLSESGKNGANKRWNKNNDNDSHPIATPLAPLKPSDSTLHYTTEQSKEVSEGKEVSTVAPIGAVRVASAPEIQMAFERVWNAYPGRGKNGESGGAYKGSKKNALKFFTTIYKQTKEIDRENLCGSIITGCTAYAEHLDRSGNCSAHCSTWLNARRWLDDYSSTQAPTGSRASGYSIEGALALALADKTRNPGP